MGLPRWHLRDSFFPLFLLFFSLSLSLSHARARTHTHFIFLSLSPASLFCAWAAFHFSFHRPFDERAGLPLGRHDPGEIQLSTRISRLFLSLFLFFSLIRYVPPVSDRFKGLQPGLRWRPCGSYPRIIRKVCPVVTETRHAGRQSESPRLSRSFDGLISPLDFGRQNGSLNQNGW